MSVIFWGVNGRYKVSFIDSVYLCYSAYTNTGLQSIDLSRTTPFQQALLFIQIFSGSIIVVSWIVVLVRKNIMAKHCEYWVAQRHGFRATARGALTAVRRGTLSNVPTTSMQNPSVVERGISNVRTKFPARSTMERSTGVITPFRRYPIRRVDTALKRVDPSGRISRDPTNIAPSHEDRQAFRRDSSASNLFGSPSAVSAAINSEPLSTSQPSAGTPGIQDPEQRLPTESVPTGILNLDQQGETPRALTSSLPPIIRTITDSNRPANTTKPGDFVVNATPRNVGFGLPTVSIVESMADAEQQNTPGLRQRRNQRINEAPLPRSFTYSELNIRRGKSSNKGQSVQMPEVDQRFVAQQSIGLGGFPGPIDLLSRLFRRLRSSRLGRIIHGYPSISLSAGSAHSEQLERQNTKQVPYFSFSAIVGRNSAFHGLTEEELYELGGVEYRALSLLSTLVPAYYIGVQAISWALNASLFSKQKYQSLFQGQWRYISPAWAGVFMATSSTTNTGMSLVDTALIPFQNEFGVLIMTSFNSLAGNTAFPIFLRLIIWIGTKVRSQDSETWATLHFLLDHPRRCFFYLFPSHQTWFLVIVLFTLNMINWAGFMLFDIGNHALDAIPLNQRFMNGFLQATSVRCAGVASVSLSLLAPATQVLFVIMMYIAPYPILLAVRATNVYQDKALGIYEDDSDDEDEQEANFRKDKRARPLVWGSYLAWHARRQLAYDIWWLIGAWLVIAIFERSKMWNPATKQFDLFGIVFELVSAYGSVGLSLGLSNANYSLSGVWSVPSKIVLVLVMIRGRSRGLPVAIDRAVMLPKELTRVARRQQQIQREEEQQQPNKLPETINEKES
ncbi:low affinity potassium transporter [Serendipita sp. 399]|nr:low affinity potassium transporter [Serendipita sp. 399]